MLLRDGGFYNIRRSKLDAAERHAAAADLETDADAKLKWGVWDTFVETERG